MIPTGAKLAVLAGDPFKKGLYTIRLQMPDGYHIPAHWHTQTEYVTVISGTFNMGMGDKLDEANGHEMPAGSYAIMPAKMRHYAWTTGDTMIQIHAMGPFDIFYVNAADDPRNKGH